jgi:fructose-bisphosphate aldolase, class I
MPAHGRSASWRWKRPVLTHDNHRRVATCRSPSLGSREASERTAVNSQQAHKIRFGRGFIAALDQSGGSTPGALKMYGIPESSYQTPDQMFDLMHAMRSRIITSPSFTGDRILGSILFENTMEREIAGRPVADYLWIVKNIVPFVKVDNGLADEFDGVRLMKPMPNLASLLERATEASVFGTKMRSVINAANESGVKSVVNQQFDVARQILESGLAPIIEPEINIKCPDKAAAEALLNTALLEQLEKLGSHQNVLLKLTLPDRSDFYADLVGHPRVWRVFALSGGYSQKEASVRLASNHGVVASFSRALTEGLSVAQDEAEFDAALLDSVCSIYEASITLSRGTEGV